MPSVRLAKGYRPTSCLFVLILVLVVIMGTMLFRSSVFLAGDKAIELSFIPANYKSCEDLVPNVSMSNLHEQMKPEFQMTVDNSTVSQGVEGYSAQVVGQYKTMHYLAGQRHVKTVCETGFNLGHSSFNYLTANDQLVVHSFDLGQHDYAFDMAQYMWKKFPGRIFIHFGDSTITVPMFSRRNPHLKCDLIFVDGGHTYPVALADIRNFAMIANLEENLILFDDYPTDWGKDFGKAWDDMVQAGVIREEMRCTSSRHLAVQRGFTIGRVIKRPK